VVRIAHSTRLDDLIKSPFVLQLDNRFLSVDARQDVETELRSVLGNVEIHDLTVKAYYSKIRERLANAKHHHMPYSSAESFSLGWFLLLVYVFFLQRIYGVV